ncbi:MAG: hypothetical protein KFH98_00140 [Gemmatimonadetes bacterium]|nr:hypothetical protein [Gemmatimonadota bacterium]
MIHQDRQPQLLAALAVLLVSGCAPPFGQFPPGEDVIEVGTPGEYLTCARTAAAARPDTQVVGPPGGQLMSGANQLTIPANALPENRTLVLRQEYGNRVGVVIDADPPVRFAGNRSATLIIDIGHCDSDEIGDLSRWSVWRMAPPRGNQSQRLRTFVAGSRMRTQIDSTSGFMIAN